MLTYKQLQNIPSFSASFTNFLNVSTDVVQFRYFGVRFQICPDMYNFAFLILFNVQVFITYIFLYVDKEEEKVKEGESDEEKIKTHTLIIQFISYQKGKKVFI